MDGSCEGEVLRCPSCGADGGNGEGGGRGRAGGVGAGGGADTGAFVGAAIFLGAGVFFGAGVFVGACAVGGTGAGFVAGFVAGAGRGSRDDDAGVGGSDRGITGSGIGVLLNPVNRYLALTAGRPSDFNFDFDFDFALGREVNTAGADFLGLGFFAFTAGALVGFFSLSVGAEEGRAGEAIPGESRAGESRAGEAWAGDDARQEGGGGSGLIVWRGIYPRLSKGRFPILAKDWKISYTTYAPQA